jgi:hypothetical protein
MKDYWFTAWLREYRVRDQSTLRKVLNERRALESLLQGAPSPTVHVRKEPSDYVELTAGKGVDLTGELGCRHIDCLSKEIEGLFRHAWHYFDTIRLPDQALYSVVRFKEQPDVDDLATTLLPFVLVLRQIQKSGGQDLVAFEVRTPSCREHLADHARDANIEHAFANTMPLVKEIARAAAVTFEPSDLEGHRHLEYRVDYSAFEHSEWGSLCERAERIPESESAIKQAIANDVLRKYMAALSADALAARRSHTALGATIAFYRRLLATHPSPQVEDVAFDLALPISPDLPIELLIKLRRDEKESFQRFQGALRTAIVEQLKSAGSDKAADYARDIKRDVIEPALRGVRDKLAASQKFAVRSAATGVGLGVIAATIGLFSPVSANPVGAGLAVGGAITLGAGSLKKANDDLLLAQQELSLSDMYFLWKAHQH